MGRADNIVNFKRNILEFNRERGRLIYSSQVSTASRRVRGTRANKIGAFFQFMLNFAILFHRKT